MEFVTILIIAVGLAMDAFAVSIASGGMYKQLSVKHSLRMAVFFGGFQAFMPLVGSLAGLSVKNRIANYDHWIAFGVLTAIGGKMIYESVKIKSAENNFNPADILVLLVLAVATSIDALAVGFTLSLITAHFVLAVIIIGLVTFVLSYVGVYIGKKLGHFFESKIEALGGLVLIGLGFKILLQHWLF